MKRFREFIARLIVIVVLTGLTIAAAQVMTNTLPTWATLLILAAVLVWLALPPKDKYFLFLVQDGKGKDYVAIARDREAAPASELFNKLPDCRVKGFTEISKSAYGNFVERAKVSQEVIILN